VFDTQAHHLQVHVPAITEAGLVKSSGAYSKSLALSHNLHLFSNANRDTSDERKAGKEHLCMFIHPYCLYNATPSEISHLALSDGSSWHLNSLA
jgi:hypothetical protein